MKYQFTFSLMVIVGFGTLAACANDLGPSGTGGTSGTGGVVIRTCDDLTNPPPGCGTESCAVDADCTGATHCLNLVCTAQCTPTEGCAADEQCSARGRCVPLQPDGGTGGMGGTGGNGCIDKNVTPTRIIPNIMMIVDRSGSMNRDFNGNNQSSGSFTPPSRWNAVEDALVGPSGLVRELDGIARFGVTLYWKENSAPNQPDGSMCAETDVSTIAASNANTIASMFTSNDPDGYTPTAEAIDAVTDDLLANPPAGDDPVIYLLATDGVANGCNENTDPEDETNSLAAVTRARTLASNPGWSRDTGIDTYVLGVNFDTDHLDELAVAGTGAGSTAWTADSVGELQTALETIVSSQVSCIVDLNDKVADQARACDEGDIRLDGTPLSCPTDWQLVPGGPGEDDQIELLGAACNTWKTTPSSLTAKFPCGIIVE